MYIIFFIFKEISYSAGSDFFISRRGKAEQGGGVGGGLVDAASWAAAVHIALNIQICTVL
jgi:hypothetical protein